jgi:Family of unknown function (DUF6519)
MKADLSRYGFDARKHYSSVLHQQGRVITDADLNEEHALQEYRSARTAADVIGAVGAPEGASGFAIRADTSSVLTIGAGRLYVDGVLLENDADLAYASQVHWSALPASPGADVRQQLTTAGTSVGLVYLEAFRRTVTAIDDDSIRDVALGGPDTSARTQLVWRVGVVPIAAAANGLTLPAATVAALATRVDEVATARANLAAASTDVQRRTRRQELTARRRALRTQAAAAGLRCERDYAEWTALVSARTGTATIGTNPAPTTASPCDVPPGSGYFSGENQLYRIEVHQAGATGTSADSTFKFSRENASVVALIEAAGTTETGTVTAAQVRVNSSGRDVDLGFADGQWVEYADDALELAGVSGPLVQIQRVRRESSLIDLATAIQIRFGLHPKLRRWDQEGAGATGNGVAMAPSPVALERNLRVSFDSGTYRAGDYWMFPARGGVPDTHLPSGAQLPAGPRRHYARLGLLLLDATNRLRLLFDCRPNSPQLTALEADDIAYTPGCDRLNDAATVQEALDILCATQASGGRCTAVATPGEGWERVFQGIAAGADAEICLPIGAYPTPAGGVVVQGRGHLTIAGSGNGTRIDNASGECAIEFRGCASVTVRDLSVRARVVTVGADLRGALTCVDCRDVTVESVSLESGDSSQRNAACLTVRNTTAVDLTNAAPSLRVRRCTIAAGEQQHGVLAVNVVRAHIEDNTIVCNRAPRVRPVDELVTDAFVVKEAERMIASNVRMVPVGETPRRDEVTLAFAGRTIAFTADAMLRDPWTRFLAANPPQPGSRATDAMRHISELTRALAVRPAEWARFPAVREVLRRYERLPLSGFRGICLAGSRLQEARVLNNTIKYFRHAVHVGLSHAETSPGAPDIADSVTIWGNRIEARLMPGDDVRVKEPRPRAPHAVYVGNVDNLVVENNHATLVDDNPRARAQIGCVVHGRLGPRLIFRQNRVDGFRTAVRIVSESAALQARMWMVTDNVCFRCSTVATGPLAPPAANNVLVP